MNENIENTNPNIPQPDAREERRLAVKSLVLENFKSYAGVQEVGPFHTVRSVYKLANV